MKKIITGMTAIALSLAMVSFASAGLFGCGACDVVSDDCNACDNDCNPCDNDCGTRCGGAAGGINFWAVAGGYAQKNTANGSVVPEQFQMSGFGLTMGGDKKIGRTNLGLGLTYTKESLDTLDPTTVLMGDWMDYESMTMFGYAKRDYGRRLTLLGELGYRVGNIKYRAAQDMPIHLQDSTSTVIAKIGAEFKLIKRRRFEAGLYGTYSWYNLYTDSMLIPHSLNVNQLTLGVRGSYKMASNVTLSGVAGYDYMDASTRVIRGYGGTPIIDMHPISTFVDTNSTYFGGVDVKWEITKCASIVGAYEASFAENDYWMQTGYGGLEIEW